MHKPFNWRTENQIAGNPRRTSLARLAVALLTTLAMTATLGIDAKPAEAQGATQFVFQGRGWGHGVGMSQNGARNAAAAGLDHVAILNSYYPGAVLGNPGTLETIRVHLGDASSVELTSAGSLQFERGGVVIQGISSGAIRVNAHDGGLQIGNAWTTASATDPVFVSFPQPVKVSNNGHRYLWGKLQLTNRNGKVRVVEVLPLEDYVAGISEMPAAWPLEALMAQAITARTYAHEVTLHRRNSLEWAQEYDISGSTVDQNYIGYDAQDSAWDQKWLAAVQSTAGVELLDSNGPIRAYYSATNGGYTETAAYVFKKDVAYTVAAPDPWDAGGHDWTEWSRTYTQQSMSRWLNKYDDTAVGTLQAINVLEGAGASARIDRARVELIGSQGTKYVNGRRLMVVMNAGIFGEGGGLSTHLPGTFTTIGNGVGAGLPQPTGISTVPVIVEPDTQTVTESTVDENEGYTPPPGWRPEPGTGVAPRSAAPAPAAADSADADSGAAVQAPAPGEKFVPPAGWTPEPGTGVPPRSSASATNDATPPAAASDAAAQDSTASSGAGFTPPEGWSPEPGTGVAPRSETADTSSTSAVPEGFVPEPGTGVAPNAASTTSATDASTDEVADVDTETVGGTGGGTEFIPPPGWKPEPGTGVAPRSSTSVASSSATGTQTGGVLLVTHPRRNSQTKLVNGCQSSKKKQRSACSVKLTQMDSSHRSLLALSTAYAPRPPMVSSACRSQRCKTTKPGLAPGRLRQ